MSKSNIIIWHWKLKCFYKGEIVRNLWLVIEKSCVTNVTERLSINTPFYSYLWKIFATQGITGLIYWIAHIKWMVWHLDVGLSFPKSVGSLIGGSAHHVLYIGPILFKYQQSQRILWQNSNNCSINYLHVWWILFSCQRNLKGKVAVFLKNMCNRLVYFQK